MEAIPIIQRVIAILWPSFITAGIATVLFTTAFDPAIVFFEYGVSRLGCYTISFFLFWIFGIITAAATCFFLKPCEAIKKKNAQAAEKLEAVKE
jgi:uncharacterized membrane protein